MWEQFSHAPYKRDSCAMLAGKQMDFLYGIWLNCYFLQKNVPMRMTVYFPFAIIEKAYQFLQGEEGVFRQDISLEPCDEKVWFDTV